MLDGQSRAPTLIAFVLLASLSCREAATPGRLNADTATLDASTEDVRAVANERRVLERETPRSLDVDSLATSVGYDEFPSRIHAPKSASNPRAHKLLMNIGKQVYQQALMAYLTGDLQYATNAQSVIQKVVDVDLNFKGDPAQPGNTNDNRYLEAAWLMSHMARGANILDRTAPAQWKRQQSWQQTLDAFNAWVDRGRDTSGTKPILQLIADPGTMRWVSQEDTQGSTNRTFALLEAQMRLAELRGGSLAPGRPIAAIFSDFRGYLSRYWTPERDCRGDPAFPDSEKLRCLPNKDEFRNDTAHPLMGLASIVHIVDIGRRHRLSLSAAESEQVIKGLRWGADNNTRRAGDDAGRLITYDVPVWEMARRHFPAGELGPLCERDWRKARSADWSLKAGLAWGFTLLAKGY